MDSEVIKELERMKEDILDLKKDNDYLKKEIIFLRAAIDAHINNLDAHRI